MKFLSSLKKLYRWAHFLPKNTFKIVDVAGTPQNKDILVTYQVCGTATVVNEKPEKIVDELLRINGFSKEDSEIIHTLATTEKLTPNFRIVTTIFEKNSVIFELEDIQLKSTFTLKPEEIINSPNLINNLSVTDVMAIYFQYIKNEVFENRNHKKLEVVHLD
jgi:hypothetical protein